MGCPGWFPVCEWVGLRVDRGQARAVQAVLGQVADGPGGGSGRAGRAGWSACGPPELARAGLEKPG